MRIIKTLSTFVIAVFLLLSCEDESSPIFTVQEDTGGIEFLNSFASEYLLSEEIKTNIADRLIWNTPNYGVQTNINYLVEGAIRPEFNMETDSVRTIATTSETNFPLLVNNLLSLSSDVNIDDNPNTTNENGLPNNSGTIYLRVKAFLGTEESPTNIVYTSSEAIIITIIEKVDDGSCDALYALGDAIIGVGWNFPGTELLCESNILEGKIQLTAGTFRFFQTVGDWDSGLNYTSYSDAGYTIDSNLEDTEDADHNFKFTGADGIYTLQIDNQSKKITLTPSSSLWVVGDAVPGGWSFNTDTVELIETAPNIWSASITLNNGIFRFFPTFEDWGSSYNYPYYEEEGFTIDENFENQGESDENFRYIGTSGTYTLTINAVNKTITLD